MSLFASSCVLTREAMRHTAVTGVAELQIVAVNIIISWVLTRSKICIRTIMNEIIIVLLAGLLLSQGGVWYRIGRLSKGQERLEACINGNSE